MLQHFLIKIKSIAKANLKIHHGKFSYEETQVNIFSRPATRFRFSCYISYSDNRCSGVVNTYIFYPFSLQLGCILKSKF